MISAQESCFDFARESFIFATTPKSEARNRIRIINGLSPFIMRSDSELLIFIFDLKKGWACLCSPILQNPTGQNLI